MPAGPRPEQHAGCLVGQCLGDALGFPVEGRPPGVCRRYADEVLASRNPELICAAMAGAVSGACLGLEALPPALTARLNDRGRWTTPELIELACGCYRITMARTS